MAISEINLDDAQAFARYGASFPTSRPLQKYTGWSLDWTKEYDLRKEIGMDIKKAFDIANMPTGSTDMALIPIYPDPAIIDITRKATPLVELIPRVTTLGRTADYNQLTARGRAVFASEGEALTEADDTYARASTAIKYLYATGKVTGPSFAASLPYLRGGGYIDAVNLEVTNKTVSIREEEEYTILNGNASSNAKEFTGLRNLITTNTNDNSGGKVSLSLMRDGIRTAEEGTNALPGTMGGGQINLGVTDQKTFNDVKALMQSQLRYSPQDVATKIAWGLTAIDFEGVPIIKSKHMPRTAGSRELLWLDTRVIEMRVLQDVTYEELSKAADYRKFMLKEYIALICKAEQFCYRQYGLA